ncbi:hypothetical protein [Marinospirillum sp.]|uniref:hypothetical protein n=1 Tax=Marinospirillum sp. TaxID=2183934 RepID=UPI00286FB0D0|nr:hypothetical protein [Marinospirillum sp.]MDR9468390.1 hypothetical protein [Marinospirillum sp.]
MNELSSQKRKYQALIERYDSLVKGCEIHREHIQWDLQELAEVMPMTTEQLNLLPRPQLAILDQYVFRFSKLQDALGNKLFPAIMGLLNEEEIRMPWADIADQLEKYHVLESAEDWGLMREARNELAHDYPLDDDMKVASLNAIYKYTPDLLKIFQQAKSFAEPYKQRLLSKLAT